MKTPEPARPVEQGDRDAELRLEWRDGPPPKPWSEEWFIALTTYGDRVVLRALPEEYTYDFRTADETYIKADRIKKWMQFPDSSFIAPDAPRLAAQSSPGREAVIEECARVAQCHSDDRGGRDRHFDWHDGYQDGCRGAATAIRALSANATQPRDERGS